MQEQSEGKKGVSHLLLIKNQHKNYNNIQIYYKLHLTLPSIYACVFQLVPLFEIFWRKFFISHVSSNLQILPIRTSFSWWIIIYTEEIPQIFFN